MSAEQLLFDLGEKKLDGRDQLLRSQSNELALKVVENFDTWPQNKLILVGPQGCGKSHISSILASELDGLIVSAKNFDLSFIQIGGKDTIFILEDMEKLAQLEPNQKRAVEEAIFHFLVKYENTDSKIFITGAGNPALWDISLPDLNSRLKTFLVAKIFEPDDQLFINLILKNFSEKQLNVSPDILTFISARIERTYASIRSFVNKVDAKALRHKRKLTLDLVKSVLKDSDK